MNRSKKVPKSLPKSFDSLEISSILKLCGGRQHADNEGIPNDHDKK